MKKKKNKKKKQQQLQQQKQYPAVYTIPNYPTVGTIPILNIRRVWRYQRGNQKPYNEEEQTK